MKTTWYCTDCETEIENEETDEHEREGHQVRGVMRPERLIGNNPWDITVHHEGQEGH
ncbi:MAG: hypothetical protein V5A18_02590 [Haloarculaceae archaeon]